MTDPIQTRLANLEAVCFAGIPATSTILNLFQAGPTAIMPAPGLLVVLSANGPVEVALPLPTSGQTNWTIVFLDCNGQPNTVKTPAGGIVATNEGAPAYVDTLFDSQQIGQFAMLTASGNLWVLGPSRIGYNQPWTAGED